MPSFNYVELRLRNELDRRRQRVAVRVSAGHGDASLFLGDVWCGLASGRWYFTTGPANLRRGDTSDGYRTREEAARALFDARIAAAETHVQEAVAEANALLQVAGEDLIGVTRGSHVS